MRRGRSPFQHVEPPGIVGEMHADMVGHEVEDQAEIVLLQRRAQPLEAGFAAELRIELGVIDDVIAVGRALARLHEGRGIEMRDAERLQIGHDGGGGVEIEIRGELQAVGRDRNGRRHCAIRCARTPTRAGCCSFNSLPQIRVPLARAGRLGDLAIRQVGEQRQRGAVAHAPAAPSANRCPPHAPRRTPHPASRGMISRRRIASSSCTSASRCCPGGLVARVPIQHRRIARSMRPAGRGPRRHISHRRRQIPCAGPGARPRRDRPGNRRRTGTAPSSPIPRP